MKDHVLVFEEWKIPFYNSIHLGEGTILSEDKNGMFLKDGCGVYMLYQPDPIQCERWLKNLDPHAIEIMMILGNETKETVDKVFGFQNVSKCESFYWPFESIDPLASNLNFHQATMEDLPWIQAHYELLDQEEIKEYLQQKLIWIATKNQKKIGFAGQHSEGSMGLLYVLEPFRHQGYAQELERFMIKRMLEQDLIPYADVFDNNKASIHLQQKIGMKRMEKPVFWVENS
ncbi:GNAT family N-acetyltransferase [Dubosiella newyorkensis]|uniref:GNAT family N-acetyltransferase n=1 Tax=Dubosiella newyorkensis TaxID=1862672 RepID=UPI00248BA8BA|nr:GNAT family N-acetyltransferase [Dubosiella newyorkensis]